MLTGGDPVPAALAPSLPRRDLVIAADSGLALAPLLGLTVDIVIGDLDSLDPTSPLGETEVIRHPTDKDRSDLELALDEARRHQTTSLIVVGGRGGRLDHLLANVATISTFPEAEVTWLTGEEAVYLVRTRRRIRGEIGDLLTLLPVGGEVKGVTVEGLHWPLDDADLDFGTTRGLSNLLVATEVTISVTQGTLLAIHTTDSPTLD